MTQHPSPLLEPRGGAFSQDAQVAHRPVARARGGLQGLGCPEAGGAQAVLGIGDRNGVLFGPAGD